MADSAYISGIAFEGRAGAAVGPRHAAMVRVTHWINTLSFLGLVVSGFGILLAHPRFYWGETGGVGTPSLFDLPLPFMLGGPSGWGRYLHFESAWLCVLNGLLHVASGVASGHFRKNLGVSRDELSWAAMRRAFARRVSSRYNPASYNVVQRMVYLSVIFVWFPLMIWTGLAMSPAVTSVFPALVTVLGGHQCARTIHFFGAVLLVLFVVVHIAMVWRAGFWKRVGAMITGGTNE